MLQKVKNISAAILIGSLFMGCATKVTRISADSTVDLTGKWNDTDSRLVAEEMVKDAMARPWIQRYEINKTTPKVIIGEIRNMSHEHISVETFSKDIERSLLNSGKVDFVASKGERDQIRDEKNDQSKNASVDTRKMSGEENGADLMMTGTLNTIVDQEGDKAVVFYQTNLELVEIQTHKKVWIGEKKIKKYVERSSTKF